MRQIATLNFASIQKNVSGFCPKCGMSFPIEEMRASVKVDLLPYFDSTAISVNFYGALPDRICDNSRGLAMGPMCPHCNRPMVLIDTGIITFIKRFNALKLFTNFCCEGHYETSVMKSTGITKYDDCANPYIAFQGTGRILKDILVFICKKNNLELAPIREGNTDYTIVHRDGQPAWADSLHKIVWNTTCQGLYSARSVINEETFEKAISEFQEAIRVLLYNLPTWIHEWYFECKDDGDMIVNTEAHKEMYKKAWDNNITVVDIVQLPCDYRDEEE